jgi:DNA-binding MarR family transcriptional regulator
MFIKSKTYELGIAEMLMARQANNFRNRALKPYGLSSVEWFVLGLIQSKSAEGGIRVTDLATILDVQTTYITATLNSLRAKGYVDSLKDHGDARVRLLVITPKGSKAVTIIEGYMQTEMAKILQGKVTGQQLENYLAILQQLTQVDSKAGQHTPN